MLMVRYVSCMLLYDGAVHTCITSTYQTVAHKISPVIICLWHGKVLSAVNFSYMKGQNKSLMVSVIPDASSIRYILTETCAMYNYI